MNRSNNRNADQSRPITIIRNFLQNPDASVLIETGRTKIICSATIDENVPPYRKGTGLGWVTAEYAMLPAATSQRNSREYKNGRVKGRTQEIQRMIGRSLRAIVDMEKLGERTILLDTDVIQADGGTRTTAINGAYVALYDAIRKLVAEKKITKNPIREHLAAVSVGVVGGEFLLDLDYSEDFAADVDLNVVMTESGKLVEVQGTAEKNPFSVEQLVALVGLAQKGIKSIIKQQKEVLNS
ncbi:MAG: ribonuclease PH [Candidatus Margulisiibacteriota bacterium]